MGPNTVTTEAVEARLPNYVPAGERDLRNVPHEKVTRARWPAIRTHPRTGRPILFINEQHSHHFDGLTIEESHGILDQAFRYMYTSKTIYRHVWKNGDLVIWDNLAISHGRRATPSSQAKRNLRRVKIGVGAYAPYGMLWENSQPGV